MFKIECFVDDENLATLLKAIADKGAFNVTPVPVAEPGKPTKNKADGRGKWKRPAKPHKLMTVPKAGKKKVSAGRLHPFRPRANGGEKGDDMIVRLAHEAGTLGITRDELRKAFVKKGRALKSVDGCLHLAYHDGKVRKEQDRIFYVQPQKQAAE